METSYQRRWEVKLLLGFGKHDREISPLQGISKDSAKGSAKGREALSNTLSRLLP